MQFVVIILNCYLTQGEQKSKVGINKFFRALKGFGVNKDDINNEPIKTKYNNIAQYSTN